jgi:hypothetical protein
MSTPGFNVQLVNPNGKGQIVGTPNGVQFFPTAARIEPWPTEYVAVFLFLLLYTFFRFLFFLLLSVSLFLFFLFLLIFRSLALSSQFTIAFAFH